MHRHVLCALPLFLLMACDFPSEGTGGAASADAAKPTRAPIEAVVRKERTLWMWRHTRIHLDRVDGLGDFLELETVARDISVTEAEDEAARVITELALDRADFLFSAPTDHPAQAPPEPDALDLETLERQTIRTALSKHGGNISRAADELGLTRRSLYRRIEKYGL